MSGVRVLVGTRKGAFVLNSDGKRERWDVSGPHFAGWEIYHVKGSPADPDRLYASQSERLVRAADPALRRRRHDLGAGGQQVQLRRRARDAPVVRRHAAPVGVRAGLAPGAVAGRSGHGLRRGGGRRAVPLGRRRAVLAGAARAAQPRLRAVLAAGRGRDVPAHDHPGPEPHPARMFAAISAAGAFRSDDAGPDVAAGEPRPALGGHPRRGRRGRPLRAPDRDAPVAAGGAVHAEALGRHAQRRRRRVVARGQRQPADRLRVPDRRARARAGHHLRGPDHERLAALPARREAARLPQPDRRGRLGGAQPRACRRSTATSTCCATRWPSTRSIDCGVYFGTTGGQVYASADAGDSWAPIVRDLPAVLSVEVQTLP